MARQDRVDLSVNGWNAQYVDALYQKWLEDPGSVDEQWRTFFQGFDLGSRFPAAKPAPPEEPQAGKLPRAADRPALTIPPAVAHTPQGRVDSLVYHYRDNGHFAADLDPLGERPLMIDELRLEFFGLSESDLKAPFDPGHLPLPNPSTLGEIVDLLDETYCGHVGVEYMHIQETSRRRWLQARMEPVRNKPPFSPHQKLRILRELIEADAFEGFLHTRYRGQKRFGLDGGESLIPMLDELAEFGPDNGVMEFIIGMAHRGRLNVLVNILHKTYDQILTEFEDAWTEDFLEKGGDVKYHRGYSGDFVTEDGHNIRMTLASNPSHLEYVNSVVLGRVRAKQRLRQDHRREQCMPVLIHGDASFPGQGVVAECLNLMRLDGYTVGGAIHIIVNNQIGFTTGPRDAHSGRYCTDIAKMVDAPIFHVNGDDPEACVFAARLAIAFRQKFKNDVVIDMWCYRQHGHNEGDEPSFTQPLMYRKIKDKTPVVNIYAQRLIEEGLLTREQFDEWYAQVKGAMDEAQTRSRDNPVRPHVTAFGKVWAGLSGTYHEEPVETSVPRETLIAVSRSLGTVPEDFNPHRKLKKLLTYRRESVEQDQPLDWAMGELLAYGTLLLEDHAVRLTGQDVERGTFSHRHSVLFDQEDGRAYEPINNIDSRQAKFCVHNSPLSEAACLGFEYGYSLGDPHMLVIWEAQFGDFANGAQVIIDQFIASAEQKWRRFSGLVCFLPHGYEGQGPEHSSARLERFLTLCADDDMQVVYPTTPAQFFHLLRRQMKRDFRKPLIVMTPKSLLRHPKVVSSVNEFEHGRFHHMLDDPAVEDAKRVSRLVLCTGKVYYDLVAHREKVKRDDVALVRIEQLFPFRNASFEKILQRYQHVDDIVWVQEEPKNMGAFRHMDGLLRERFDLSVPYVGREASASPAVASHKMHLQQQESIMVSALGLASDEEEEPSQQAQKSEQVAKTA